MSIQDEVTAFKQQALGERLAQLTQPQRDFFWRIFSAAPPHAKLKVVTGDVATIPFERLETCIDLCDRTIRKNEADPARVA